jgi:hypothetical protein
VIRGQWMFDSNKGFFIAVKYWNGSGMNTFLIKSRRKDNLKIGFEN